MLALTCRREEHYISSKQKDMATHDVATLVKETPAGFGYTLNFPYVVKREKKTISATADCI